jgi:hypothetical protein
MAINKSNGLDQNTQLMQTTRKLSRTNKQQQPAPSSYFTISLAAAAAIAPPLSRTTPKLLLIFLFKLLLIFKSEIFYFNSAKRISKNYCRSFSSKHVGRGKANFI